MQIITFLLFVNYRIFTNRPNITQLSAIRGKAISADPNIKGTNQLPNPQLKLV